MGDPGLITNSVSMCFHVCHYYYHCSDTYNSLIFIILPYIALLFIIFYHCMGPWGPYKDLEVVLSWPRLFPRTSISSLTSCTLAALAAQGVSMGCPAHLLAKVYLSATRWLCQSRGPEMLWSSTEPDFFWILGVFNVVNTCKPIKLSFLLVLMFTIPKL